MDTSDPDNFSFDMLEDITQEVLHELETNEPVCLSELREASKLKFRYEILDQIDQGGMKNVYKAVDKKTRRDVALAYIKSDKLTEKNIRYFIQEAWITAKLEHPNIVPIHDIGLSPDGTPYFAMKLLSGKSLRSILKKISDKDESYCSRFSRRHLLDIFIKICDAIAYAHECGVVHLDLKPDNIQISDFGQVLVLDWGIANVLHLYEEETEPETLSNLDYTMCGAVKGTPGYISPEIMTNSQAYPDLKADIYGLGAILYSLLTHSRPSQLETTHDAIDTNEVQRETLQELEATPSALQSVILKAMQIDPAQRYDSAEELKADVEAYLAGHATQAEEAGFLRQQILLIKRNSRIFTTIGISLLLIITMASLFVFRLSISEKRAVNNEQRALEQEKLALEREKQATVLLKKYQEEKLERERRGKTSYKHYIALAYDAYSVSDLDRAYKHLDTAVKMDPKNGQAYHIKVNLLLVQQKFNKIVKELEKHATEGRYELAQKYAAVKSDERLLSENEFMDYIADMAKTTLPRKNRFMSNVFNLFNGNRTYASQEKRIRETIRILFPYSKIEYDRQKDRVTIFSSTPYCINIIAGLNFKELNLSHARFKSSGVFWTLPNLEYLNLKNTDTTVLHPINKMNNLRYLNLENSPLSYVRGCRSPQTLHYLNIAKTDLITYPWEKWSVTILNAVESHQMDLQGLVESKYPPKIILLTPEQLSSNTNIKAICRRRNIKIKLFDSANDVDENELLR